MEKNNLEFVIKVQRDFINKLITIHDWSLEANKKVIEVSPKGQLIY